MVGAIALAVVLVFVVPVMIALSGAAASGILGYFLKEGVESDHEGSELVAVNR